MKEGQNQMPDETCSSHVLPSSQRSQEGRCQMKIALRTFFRLHKDRRKEGENCKIAQQNFIFLLYSRWSFFKTLTSLYTVGLGRERKGNNKNENTLNIVSIYRHKYLTLKLVTANLNYRNKWDNVLPHINFAWNQTQILALLNV